MNITNIILELQRISQTTEDTFTLMVLSKVIQQLEVGKVEVVSTINNLPSLPLETDGNIYLVESDSELYYNVGSDWYSFPLKIDNILYAWGENISGQLGDETNIRRSSPVTVIGGITNWSQISAGGQHTIALTDAGILYAWGSGANGRLGNNTVTNRSSPVTVIGGITNWSQISAGGGHCLALTDTGILYAWGNNTRGQIGDETITPRSSPITVVGGITNWSQISANYHSLALTDTGILYAWGGGFSTNFGQLGDGTSVFRSSPVTVIGGITNWSQISAGGQHTIALTDAGILYAWGDSVSGQLGDGTNTRRSSPVTVIGGLTNWSQISAGDAHTIALTDTGILYAWGSALSGEIGTGDTISKNSPVTVVGGITNWSQVSAGGAVTMALTGTGILYAWGFGGYGYVGDGTTISRSSPVTVVGGITNWSQISPGNQHSVAIVTQRLTL
jgi:alpha-tubulin suppressor-like RCC1 family protein